ARLLAGARCLGIIASLVPLLGLVLPFAFAWLVLGIVIGGTMHVFDQPARKATLGDITERDELAPAVAFNNAAAHGAAISGSVLAFALGPVGLVLAALLLAFSAVLALGVEPPGAQPLQTPGR